MNGRLSDWPMFNASMARLLVSHYRSRRKPTTSPSLWIERMEERRVCAVVIGLANDTGASRIDRVTSDPTIALNRPIATGQRVDYTVNGGPSQTAAGALISSFNAPVAASRSLQETWSAR